MPFRVLRAETRAGSTTHNKCGHGGPRSHLLSYTAVLITPLPLINILPLDNTTQSTSLIPEFANPSRKLTPLNCSQSIKALIVTILGLASLQLCAAESKSPISDLWLPDLESLKQEIETELSELAHPSLNSGVGAVGYRSKIYEEPYQLEWVKIDLRGNYTIDTIFLVPSLWRTPGEGFQNDGFPETFRIIAGGPENPDGEVIFEYDADIKRYTGILPMQIPVDSETASWVRLEASRLGTRGYDGQYVFQLSEFMIFQEHVNIALHKPVSASSKLRESPIRNAAALVDGILPYLMNAAAEEHSRAYVSQVGVGEQPYLTIDMQEANELTGIRLHVTDQADTVPTAHAGDFGIPKHLTIEVANREDFSDAVILLEDEILSIYEMGPILSYNFFTHITARYLRITALEPYYTDGANSRTRISFAEIEVLSNGVNVAIDKPVTTSYDIEHTNQSITALTDGMNIYGPILPQRQWLGELAQRHELTEELKFVEAEMDKRYARQKVFLRWAIIAAICMALLIVFAVPYNKMVSYQKELRIRERIAANLHDELGANLHAIGMLGDVAERSIKTPERMVEAVRRIRGLTERTGTAARHCTHMLEAENICEDLVLDLNLDVQRLLSDYEVRFYIEGEKELESLTRRRRIDLYLFFKECLTNINRHAQATRVNIRLVARRNIVTLSVIDNGRGLDTLPKSLSRRARFLRATIKTKEVQPQGTHIRLRMKLKRNLFSR